MFILLLLHCAPAKSGLCASSIPHSLCSWSRGHAFVSPRTLLLMSLSTDAKNEWELSVLCFSQV